MPDLLEILSDWNFWRKKMAVGRRRNSYLEKLLKFSRLPEVIVISGVRRAGKSTILLQLIRELNLKQRLPYKNTLYVNFEDPRLGTTLKVGDLFNLLEDYKKKLKPRGRIYLFLDEVQTVPEWERFVRTLYDQKTNIKIFLTGSTSQITTSSLSGLLSGRLLTVKINPLDFQEFLTFKGVKKSSPKIKVLLDEYLFYGGFPRVVLEKEESNKRAILISYYETILEKDVILRNNIKNKTELKQLARFILSNPAQKISSYSLEKVLKISNVNIARYLNFLEEAFILSRVPRFSYSVKQQIYNPDRIFCVDTGLINVAGFRFSENKGWLLENVVFQKLKSESLSQIYYWQNKTEIDFLTFAQTKVKELINIALTVDDPEIFKREINSLEAASTEFQEAKLTLLTLYNESGQSDPKIRSLLDFLLQK